MSATIPQRDLRNHNAKIIERVLAGESFVITRDGVPVATLAPHVAGHEPPMFPATNTVIDFFHGTPGYNIDLWLDDIREAREASGDDPFTDPWERHGAQV